MKACGKYSIRGAGSSNTTVKTSNHISRSAGSLALSEDFKNVLAADTIRLRLSNPTLTSGETGAPALRVFTSTT